MSNIIMYATALLAVVIVVAMLIKKMDIKITLFLMGIVLMFELLWAIRLAVKNLCLPEWYGWTR